MRYSITRYFVLTLLVLAPLAAILDPYLRDAAVTVVFASGIMFIICCWLGPYVILARRETTPGAGQWVLERHFFIYASSKPIAPSQWVVAPMCCTAGLLRWQGHALLLEEGATTYVIAALPTPEDIAQLAGSMSLTPRTLDNELVAAIY